MDLIKKEKFGRKIKESFTYRFSIKKDGLYLIEIKASARSWWQNFKELRGFLQDDDLTVKINDIEFPKLNGKRGLFDGEVAWNGNNLKGFLKTVVILFPLAKGNHFVQFLADQNPYLESIAIFEVKSQEKFNYLPSENLLPKIIGSRQLLTIAAWQISVKSVAVMARADQRADDDDIKLIIDGKIEQNAEPKAHKNWYWCGRVLQGREKFFNKELNLSAGLHYFEFWVDQSPCLDKIELTTVAARKPARAYNDPAKAADGFNSEYVLMDSAFNNNDAMSEQDIQYFLDTYHVANINPGKRQLNGAMGLSMLDDGKSRGAIFKTWLVSLVLVILGTAAAYSFIFISRQSKPVYSWHNTIALKNDFALVSKLEIFSEKIAAEADGLYCGFRFGKAYQSNAKLLLTRQSKILDEVDITNPELVMPSFSGEYLASYLPVDIDGDKRKEEFIVRRYGSCNGDIISFIRVDEKQVKLGKISIIHKNGSESTDLFIDSTKSGFQAKTGVVIVQYYNNAGDSSNTGIFKDWYRYNENNNKLEWFKQEKL